MAQRSIAHTVQGIPASDGAGVRLTRVIGQRALRHLDPFLLLDEFGSDKPGDYIAGFPPHPHRGFETVTYMLDGAMKHQDSLGNTGHLGPGSVQWMTAGRGIIHSEMPEQEEGLMRGFQLWVNLPAANKMTAPRYQDIPASEVAEVTGEGHRVRVIAGAFAGTAGPVQAPHTEALYLDIVLDADQHIDVPIPLGHAGFIYVFEGAAQVGNKALPKGTLAVLGDGSTLSIEASGEGGRMLVVAGRPMGEPIVQHGPFVMNTQAQIREAIRDYHAGTLAG
jgi:quercetin 2,3-dioxygenase